MLVVTRFDVPEDEAAAFLPQAQAALAAFAARPGYLRGRVGRAADDPTAWVLTTEWEGVGDASGQGVYGPQAWRDVEERTREVRFLPEAHGPLECGACPG